jgi:hypothetical protein
MRFDTKIAIAVRLDLATWQKLNVVAFLSAGIIGASPSLLGAPYVSADGQRFLALCGQPILIYGGEGAALARTLDRAITRGVEPAIYTQQMFQTMHDAANRATVAAVQRHDLALAGLALHAERKLVDKIVDGLKFHP